MIGWPAERSSQMLDVGSLSRPSACLRTRYTNPDRLGADGVLPYHHALDRIYISPLVGVLHPIAESTPTPARVCDQSRLGGGGTVPEPLVGWAIYLQGFYN